MIIWDLATEKLLQEFDIAYAGPVTAICWIRLPDDRTDDSILSFAVGSGNGVISFYRALGESVRGWIFFRPRYLTLIDSAGSSS